MFHSHPYHIVLSQQGISRYMVVYLSSKARRGTGRLVNKFSTGDHGGHEEGARGGGRVGQDRSHSFLRPLHTALFISSAGFSSQELGSNLQSHTDSTWWTMLNSSIREKIPLKNTDGGCLTSSLYHQWGSGTPTTVYWSNTLLWHKNIWSYFCVLKPS